MTELGELDKLIDKSLKKISKKKQIYKINDIEELEYSKRWFKTSFGKNVVTQIDEIKEILSKLATLTLDFEELLKIINKIWKSDYIRDVISKDEKSIDKYETYKKLFPEDLSEVGVKIFSTEDNMRFCAFFTLSLYAYVDNYCQNLIRAILRKEHLKMHLIGRINKQRKKTIFDIEKDDKEDLNERILRYFPTNPSKKISKLMEFFSIKNKINSFLREEGLDVSFRLFMGFIRIRNELAHTNPVLTLDKIKQSNEVFKSIQKYSSRLFELQTKALDEDFIKREPFLEDYWSFLLDWFNSLIFPLSTAYTFIKATMVYLSIVDHIFFEII